MLQPTVRRTWAPQGKTPIHDSWDRHDRLSVTGAITVSPLQKRLGLYFSVASANITGDDVFTCVQQLHGHLKRPLLVTGIVSAVIGKPRGDSGTSMARRYTWSSYPRMPLS
jgi:hypothetical protein